MAKATTLPPRSKVKKADTWDLTQLFKSDAAWPRALKKLEKDVKKYDQFRGKLGQGPKVVKACFDFDMKIDKQAEMLGSYAFLKQSEDVASSTYQGMVQEYTFIATRAGEIASYIAPELQSLPKKKLESYIKSAVLKSYRIQLEKLARNKKHILSQKEERLLAMAGEIAGTANKAFSQLTDADFKFGTVKNEKGEAVELSQGSLRVFLESPKRAVRKKAFHQFYDVYEAHENTLAAVLGSSLATTVQETGGDSVLPDVQIHGTPAGFAVVLVSGAADDPERETLVVAAPFASDEQVGLFVPDPRVEKGGLLLLLLPAGMPTAAALTSAREIAKAKAVTTTDTDATPRNWQVANRAVGARNRRPALLAVVTPLGIPRITDLLLASDEAALIAISSELSRLDPLTKNLPWLVEAAAWRALVPRAERDELSPSLRAAFVRHLGGLSDDGGTLRLLVSVATNGDQFADALIDENIAALNDRSAAVRVCAVSWLHNRRIRIDNYDAMHSLAQRRSAVRRYLAAQEAAR